MRKATLYEMCRVIKRGKFTGEALAVFTSGGDAQGMNAALRAVVRFSLYVGCKVYFIREGYEGMVGGDEYIEEATWVSVSHVIHKGGTIIGSARSTDFVLRSGRLKAARNLVEKGITHLVVIGGDGSLTGANIFRQEWSGLLDELLANDEIEQEQRDRFQYLHIVGLVGSIDNDFCGTDMTIGTDTALHRIMEAIDAITSTASSHQRTFIMEVMGRHCGYLALVAASTSEAAFVFIPEYPPKKDWPDKLCSKLTEEREHGKRLNIIIVSEGAIDRQGDPITSEMVRQVVVDRLNQDARITVLGHVQRGGSPSSFDRVLASRLGCEAVMVLMESTPDSSPCVITIDGNQVVRISLVECVEQTKRVAQAMKEKRWEDAVEYRGGTFKRNMEIYTMMARKKPPTERFGDKGLAFQNYTIAVMHIGVPACGMNAAVRSVARSFVCPGSTMYGIHDGVDGLVEGNFEVIEWEHVIGWVGQAGALLGCTRTLPKKKMPQISQRLREFKIQGLIIIGGFEAFQAGLQFVESRSKYPELCIPLVVIPASTNNNIPGTEFSIGADTAVNEIMEICDRIRQASQGLKRRVYIIETMGGNCGYLATMGGLASGSDAAYINEEEFTVQDMARDVANMVAKMRAGIDRGLYLKSDKANENFNADFIQRLYTDQARGEFTTTVNVIGQMQQGGDPTPFDRNVGLKMGLKSVEFLLRQLQANCKEGKIHVTSPESAVMVGVLKRHYTITSLSALKEETNFDLRIPKEQWWMGLRSISRILSKHVTAYDDVDTVGNRAWMMYSTEANVKKEDTVSDLLII